MLRHSLFSVFLVFTAISYLAGGVWLWLGFVFLVLAALTFDIYLPDDLGSHAQAKPWLMNTFLFLTLPLLYLNVVCFNWQMSDGDFLGLGAGVKAFLGMDISIVKKARSLSDSFGGYFSLGMLIAGSGTVVAHELVHRVWDRKSVTVGRWLLALSCDTSFSIEHVYGHHAKVATPNDPASSRRGESFWRFLPRSTIGGYLGAWDIEKRRLKKRKLGPPWGHHNIFLRGQLMSLVVMGLFVVAQGAMGILSFLMIACSAKLYLELINYIEHYGLERTPGHAVEALHSWNCNARFSLYWLYNLPRHPHHHAKAQLPFWKLEANPGGPTLPFGYMTMMMMALVPPLFMSYMNRKLEDLEKQSHLREKA